MTAAIALGAEKSTKTGLGRTVDLFEPLAEDLRELRDATSHPSASDLVFPSAAGTVWSDHMYRNWRSRVFKPAALRAGATAARPYDLRHSFVSLLVYAGIALPEIARQAGHSAEVCASTYVHVFAEFDPRSPADPADRIRASRSGSSASAAHARDNP